MESVTSHVKKSVLQFPAFSSYTRPGQTHRIVFVSIALFMTFLELFPVLVAPDETPRAPLWLIIAFGILLALAGWFAPGAEIAYIVLFIFGELTRQGEYIGSPIYGIYVIAASWIIHSWVTQGLALTLLIDLYTIIVMGSLSEGIYASIVPTSLTLTLGFVFRWQSKRLAQAEEARKAAEQASSQIRHDLAVQLHDTIAKDLARISILAQQTARNTDQKKMEDLSELASRTARRIRPTILNLETARPDYTLTQAVNDSAAMLRTREITLDVEIPGDIDARLDRQYIQLASLIVREGATNILKYSPVRSLATLDIDIASDTAMSITMSNPVAFAEERAKLTEITGGFGLANLQHRVQDEGGELTFGQNGGQWLLYALIPLAQDSPLAGTQPHMLEQTGGNSQGKTGGQTI